MSTEDDLLAPSTDILVSPSRELQPAPLFTPTPKAAKRVLEFFTGEFSPPTVKQSLAALRMLFD